MDLPRWFAVEIEDDGEECVLYPAGELDLVSAPQLVHAADEVRRAAARNVRIDLHRLAFVDAAGLRVLDALQRRGFEIVEARGFVRRMMDLAGRTDLVRQVDLVG